MSLSARRTTFRVILLPLLFCTFIFPLQNLAAAEDAPVSVESLCRLNPKANRWEVTNNSDSRIRVEYKVMPSGKTRRLWLNPAESKVVSQKPTNGPTLEVSFNGEVYSAAAQEGICHIQGIEFTSVCSDNPGRRRWRVRNPNPFPVFVTYNVYGTSQSRSFYLPKAGKGVVKFEGAPEKEYRFFTTQNVGGANTTKIYYGDGQQLTKASGNQICPLPEGSVTVGSVCSDRQRNEKWVLTNHNDKRVWVQASHSSRYISLNKSQTRTLYTSRDVATLTIDYGGNTTSADAYGFCIELEEGAIVDADGIYYIDNKTDFVYHVEPDLTAGTAVLTPLLRSPYGDTHMSLNTAGDQLFLVEGRGANRYGYFDFTTLEYQEVGTLGQGAVYQVAFSPSGQMYFAANKINEVMVMADPLTTSFESYGRVKIDGSENFIDLNGADMAFDNDGTFYVATHHGQKIYTVSGKKGHLVAKELAHTNGKRVTGLAVLDAGTGDLIFSAKDQTAMTVVNINDGSFTDLDLVGLERMDWGDMTGGGLSFREICDGYADSVISYNVGTLAGQMEDSPDTAPAPERQDASNALGAPQERDNLNFVSLGFGGELVLRLSSPVYDFNKNGIEVDNPNSINFGETSYADFLIVETSYGRSNQNCGVNRDRNYPEKVLVYGAQELSTGDDGPDDPGGGPGSGPGIGPGSGPGDPVTPPDPGSGDEETEWVLLSASEGECRTSFIDVSPAIEAGLDYVKYVRLVDVSDPSRFPSSADGYDVDGLIICPDEVIAAITGEGRGGNSLVNARQKSAFDPTFFNFAPNEIAQDLVEATMIYPNPAVGASTNLHIAGVWEEAEVLIFSLSGQLISMEQIYAQKPEININHLKSGNYFAQIMVNGNTHSLKFRKQ